MPPRWRSDEMTARLTRAQRQAALWQTVEPLLLARGRYPSTLEAAAAREKALSDAEDACRAAGEILLARAVNLAYGEAQAHRWKLRQAAIDADKQLVADAMKLAAEADGPAVALDGGPSTFGVSDFFAGVEAWAREA